MNYQLKVNGIYDKRTLETAVSMGVKHFGFCFRPLSLNLVAFQTFIDELLPKIPFGSFLYFEFENQADPMIRYLSEQLNSKDGAFQRVSICLNKITGSDQCLFNSNQVLELDYDTDVFLEKKNLQKIELLKKVSALHLDEWQLGHLKKDHKLNSFFSSLEEFFSRDDLEIELKVISDVELGKKNLEFLDVMRVSLEINPSLEVCYRNVNLEKMTRRLLELKDFCHL